MQESTTTFRRKYFSAKALSAVVRTNQQIGVEMLIHILRGAARTELTEKGFHHIKTYGAGRDLSYMEWKEYIYQMIQLGFLEIDYAHANRLKVTALGTKVLYGKATAQLAKYIPPEPEKRKRRLVLRKRIQSPANPSDRVGVRG